jgi:hypothetical protein
MSVDVVIPMDELPSLTDLPQRAFNSAAYAATRDIQGTAWSIVPFRTGELIESMKIAISTTELRISFSRKGGKNKTHEIAHVIDAGAKPHTITATTSAGLRFMYGGKWVRKQSVEHPGYGGRGYLFKMKEVARQIMTQRLLEALRNWRAV